MSTSTEFARAARTEAPLCDCCKTARGVRYFDYSWLCWECGEHYMHELELEPWRLSGLEER